MKTAVFSSLFEWCFENFIIFDKVYNWYYIMLGQLQWFRMRVLLKYLNISFCWFDEKNSMVFYANVEKSTFANTTYRNNTQKNVLLFDESSNLMLKIYDSIVTNVVVNLKKIITKNFIEIISKQRIVRRLVLIFRKVLKLC